MLLTIFVKALSVWLDFILPNLNKTLIVELTNCNATSTKMLAEQDKSSLTPYCLIFQIWSYIMFFFCPFWCTILSKYLGKMTLWVHLNPKTVFHVKMKPESYMTYPTFNNLQRYTDVYLYSSKMPYCHKGVVRWYLWSGSMSLYKIRQGFVKGISMQAEGKVFSQSQLKEDKILSE